MTTRKALPLAVAGRRVDAPGAYPSRFALGDVAAVGARIERKLRDLQPRMVIGSAAAGVDLLALDAALGLHIPIRVVLPFDRERFRASSVADRGVIWTTMYDDTLRQAEAVEEMMPPDGEDGAAYAATTRRLIDLIHQEDRQAVALAVWDLQERKDSPDQSAEFVRYAHARRLRVIELTTQSEDDLPWHRSVFVMMPFGVKTYGAQSIDFDALYSGLFEPAIQLAGTSDGLPLFPTRADRGDYAALIDDVMYRRLELSQLTLADCTGGNANVMIEIGVRAKSRSSGNVFVTQKNGPPPFDLSHVRVVPYDPADVTIARQSIAALLNGTLRAAITDAPVAAAFGARESLKNSGTLREQPTDAIVATLMREAENALRQSDEAVALDRYESVLQRVQDVQVQVRAAALCVRLEYFELAVAHADSAIALDARNCAAYRERGIALGRLGNDAAAIESLRKAAELNENDYDALASLGGALRRTGDDAGALAAYERASTISNGAPYPVLNAIKLKLKSGIPITGRDEALLQNAKELRAMQSRANPPQDAPWCFFDLSDIALMLGHREEGMRWLERAAIFARHDQLKSHNRAIRPLAQPTAESAWHAAVAYLDAEIMRHEPAQI